MKTKGCFYLLTLLSFSLHAEEKKAVIVRPAESHELTEILAVDRRVSFDYWKPVFQQYSDRSVGKDADAFLEDELLKDQEIFADAIVAKNNRKLYVAVHDESIVGFVLTTQKGDSLNIDLLAVEHEFRAQGVRELIVKYLLALPHVSDCRSAAIEKNKDAVKLWESLGFTLLDKKPDDMGNDFPEDCSDIYRYFGYTKLA